MKKLLDGFSPDSVVCTQAFPCGLIADFKRNTGSNIELTGVLTDHAPHSYWLFDEVDNYVVPSGETADELVRKGVDPLRVHEMGVPIDPKFAFKHDKTLLLKAIGFDESSPVILLMGGNQGLGAMEEVLKTLIIKGQDRRYQLIIVTGANKRLYFRLQKMVSSAECDNVLILPYVDNIDELMEISDLIVTKAGGITTAESLAKGLPMILVNPIPGQERMNADYLEKKGLAIEIKDIERIPGKLKDLLEERDELTEMKKRIEEEAKPLSAIHIAELVLGTSAG
jgi:processive 1,2-diacylglycerol beta-glucosyltransferase